MNPEEAYKAAVTSVPASARCALYFDLSDERSRSPQIFAGQRKRPRTGPDPWLLKIVKRVRFKLCISNTNSKDVRVVAFLNQREGYVSQDVLQRRLSRHVGVASGHLSMPAMIWPVPSWYLAAVPTAARFHQ